MENVYSEIAAALGQVQAESVANAGNPAAGTITYGNGPPAPAFVGVFTVFQYQQEGGGAFIPALMGIVQIDKQYLGANTQFRTGQAMTVTPPLSQTRNCKIHLVEDKFSFWEITLLDVSQQ